jgi:hypothetical protein
MYFDIFQDLPYINNTTNSLSSLLLVPHDGTEQYKVQYTCTGSGILQNTKENELTALVLIFVVINGTKEL